MITTSNIILYCKNWKECVGFYRDILEFKVNTEKEWFVEFQVNEGSFISIANDTKTSIKSSSGTGITLSFKVRSIDAACKMLAGKGITALIKEHPWGGRYFFIRDPEGNRIEIWSDR